MDETLKKLVQAFDQMAGSYRLIAERIDRRIDDLEAANASLQSYARQIEGKASELGDSTGALCEKVVDLETQNRALREQNEALNALDRQKTEFLTTLSHQILTPLTVIEGWLRLLFHEEEFEAAARREFLTMAHYQVDRLIRLVTNFMNLARIESGRIVEERRDLDLALLVERAVTRLRPFAADRAIRIDFQRPPGPVIVQGDIDPLESAVVNLVDNAVKFSGQGSVVGVTVEETPREARVHVTDRGVGIPAETLDRVFERFYRMEHPAAPNTAGSGLGLFLSKIIAEAHAGWVSATSEVGVGSTFILALPRSGASLPSSP